MFLAPLNYDRFFKKVFSEKKIAKQFLEDFFEINISEIEILENRHKLTDNAQSIEFDFRCKIEDKFVIIDMQQWYKTDFVKRFYMYHTVNTALQLENLPIKSFITQEFTSDEELKLTFKNTRDYRFLEPVITLIWMVNDTLHFKEDDYIGFTMAPEVALEFIENEEFWQNPQIQDLQRKNILKILQNKHKELDFLRKNRLIYAFQPIIVKNKKLKKYLRWFEFAQKTKNKENTESEFKEYEKDEIFAEMIRRLKKDNLEPDDFSYIDNYEKLMERVELFREGLLVEGKNEGRIEGRIEGKIEGRIEGKIEGKIEGRYEIAKKMKLKGKPLDEIIELTELSKEEIDKL